MNGELNALEMQPVKPEDLKLLAEQVMTPRQVKEFAEKKEADFAIGVPGVGRFRTNVYQQRGTLAFAFRAIPYEVKTIAELPHALNAPNDTMIFIESIMDPHDAPAAVITSSNNGADLDYGPRGPQHRHNIQLRPTT